MRERLYFKFEFVTNHNIGGEVKNLEQQDARFEYIIWKNAGKMPHATLNFFHQKIYQKFGGLNTVFIPDI